FIGERNSDCTEQNLDACTTVNLFFDTNYLRADGTFTPEDADNEIHSSDIPTKPIFRLNTRNIAARDIRGKTPTFRTTLALFSPGDHPSSLMNYPFDRYTSEIVMFAQEVDSNATVGTAIGKTQGIAIGFETRITHRDDIFIPPGLTEATITLTRSTLVVSYSIVATIAIWIVTIILALVMITSVFFGFKQRPEVLLVPVATLFAFTTLRQSMPGAPEGFDLCGLVPCLALLALTTACTLGVFILSDPASETRRRELHWNRDLLYEAIPALKHTAIKGRGK
ncbi:hypothetical protein FA15DRAFT_700380, partial [Coprinopsis marcescibilis]